MATSTRRTRDPLVGRLLRGDATIVGVGQGRQTEAEARPKQAHLMQTLRHYYGTNLRSTMLETVDPDGERGVLISPGVSDASARRLGRMFAQRSVMQGKKELAVESGAPLGHYRVETVDTAPPEGFWTFLPRAGLYYKLVPVAAHRRDGRPVEGYVARRQVAQLNAELRDLNVRLERAANRIHSRGPPDWTVGGVLRRKQERRSGA